MENKVSHFFASVMNDDRLRYSFIIGPLLTATFGFLFSLLRGRGFSESLFNAAFLCLLVCFIGVVYHLVRRRNLRQ